ncbi:hypothetical protein NWT09_08025 [Mycolicibacterium sp. jd]|uniref:hypothetical protein n=1 Tax=unclassified Mycolicibacterium TaxID=2636767 RepID=UPI00351ACE26
MPEATVCPPSLADMIMRTIELGVTIADAAIDDGQATIFCRPVARDRRYPDCRQEGHYHTVTIQAGNQTLTAAELPPPDLTEILAKIHDLRALD